ncbi:MAG: hypothetical protein P4L83_01150 [Nevskia sp.]|nr:hypothetical protein [Nevskia sp.]
MKQVITVLGIPPQSETQVSAPVVRVLGGGKPWTAFEADAAELVHSLSSRVLVKARRELRRIESSESSSDQQRQRLVELKLLVQSTQTLRKADSPTQFQSSISQLRQKLEQLAAFC